MTIRTMTMQIRTMPRDRGFSMIEVMIAILVFSIGLLGAGLMAMSALKNTHNSYLRSQASFLADAVAERMSANPRAVWTGNYNATLAAGSPSMPACGTGTSGQAGCTEPQLAQRDLAVMGNLIAQQLPNGSGSIACTLNSALPAGSFTVPPVDGSCVITVSWAEVRDVDKAGYSGTQSFELVVQP